MNETDELLEDYLERTHAHKNARSLTLRDYQIFSRRTAIYFKKGRNPYYAALGLGGEMGEVVVHILEIVARVGALQEQVKKLQRDDGGFISDERRAVVSKEIGDLLWYLAALASEFNLDLGEVGVENLIKLFDRSNRDVIKGDGDNR